MAQHQQQYQGDGGYSSIHPHRYPTAQHETRQPTASVGSGPHVYPQQPDFYPAPQGVNQGLEDYYRHNQQNGAGRVDHPVADAAYRQNNNDCHSTYSEEARPYTPDSDIEGLAPDEQPSTLLIAELKPQSFLIEHSSYHNEITGKEAVKRLKLCADHDNRDASKTFTAHLIRHSEAQDSYVLDVYRRNPDKSEKHKGFRIHLTEERGRVVYYIDPRVKMENLDGLIKYYQIRRHDAAFATIGQGISEEHYYQIWSKQQEMEEEEAAKKLEEEAARKLEEERRNSEAARIREEAEAEAARIREEEAARRREEQVARSGEDGAARCGSREDSQAQSGASQQNNNSGKAADSKKCVLF